MAAMTSAVPGASRAAYNLIGNGGSGGLVNGVNGNLVGVYNPGLGTLGNYGGPTETIPLLPGSPAIGAGFAVTGVTTDQRGEPLDAPNPDIGAFQSQGFTISLAAGSTPQTAAISTAFPNPLALSVTANNPVEPVDGGVVTFVDPPVTSGASAFLSASSVVIAGGQASVSAMPSNMDGSYTVTASASGASPATFDLRNTGPAFAQLIVNTPSDSLLPGVGLLSLPEAVVFANSDRSGNANITFDPTLFNTPQTITLTGTELELSNTTETETITGPAAGVTISGGGTSRVLAGRPWCDRLDLRPDHLRRLMGRAWRRSGELRHGDAHRLHRQRQLQRRHRRQRHHRRRRVEFRPRQPDHDRLYHQRQLRLYGSAGGGVANSRYANLVLTDCTVSGNSAGGLGGGGVVNYGGTITLTDCTVDGNTERSVGGEGGGVFSSSGTVDLTDCTISGNDAPLGGGVYIGGDASNYYTAANLTDCTLSGNSARYDGGGVFNAGTANLTDCTLSGNSAGYGGGVFNAGTANLTDTIVAGNTDPSGPSDILANSNVSGSDNLIGTGGSGGLVNGVEGNIVLTSLANLSLAPLANNGGPTETMALLPGSAAIDAGSDSIAGITIPDIDQRGALRGPAGLNAGAADDIGAYEASSSYLVTSTADSFDVGTLRAAIGWANVSTNANPANIANPAPNTIVFALTGAFATPQVITLSASLGTLQLSNTSTAESIAGPRSERDGQRRRGRRCVPGG